MGTPRKGQVDSMVVEGVSDSVDAEAAIVRTYRFALARIFREPREPEGVPARASERSYRDADAATDAVEGKCET